MNLPCKVIEDILPMYYDGVCSDESRELVDKHLAQCEKCRIFLSQLQTGIAARQENIDDLKPLKEIQKRWQKSKHIAMRKGICLTLVVLLVISFILSGAWYLGYGRYYAQMAQKLEPITGDEASMTVADYKKEINGYRFDVAMPFILSNNGFARVTDEKGMVMFIYPEAGGNYSFKVSLYEDANSFHMVWLRSDLTPNYEDHPLPVRTEWEKACIAQLLEQQKGQILEMCRAVYALWGIELVDENLIDYRLNG